MKKQYSYLELELQKLGLNRNEAKIYLATLELGQSSVQNLANKTSMSRPTVYRTLESLQKKELIEKLDRKKGRSVTPKSPDELLSILRIQKRKVDEQEREFTRIISLLKTEHYISNKKPFEIFEGENGKKFILNELTETHAKKISVIFGKENVLAEKDLLPIFEKIKKRLGKIDVHELFVEKSKEKDTEYIKKKNICEKSFSGTLVIAHKVFYFHENQIFSIEEEFLTKLIKSLFDLSWTE